MSSAEALALQARMQNHRPSIMTDVYDKSRSYTKKKSLISFIQDNVFQDGDTEVFLQYRSQLQEMLVDLEDVQFEPDQAEPLPVLAQDQDIVPPLAPGARVEVCQTYMIFGT